MIFGSGNPELLRDRHASEHAEAFASRVLEQKGLGAAGAARAAVTLAVRQRVVGGEALHAGVSVRAQRLHAVDLGFHFVLAE